MSKQSPAVRFSTIICLCLLVVIPPVDSAERHDDSKNIKALAGRICLYYNMSGKNIARDAKKAIKKYMTKYEGIQHPTGKQMLLFLNKNKHKMTCKRDGLEKNYMMVAFDRSAHNALFDGLLFSDLTPRDRKIKPDVNAVSYTGKNGIPETVLDYMNRIIANKRNSRGFIKEVQNLKDTFVKHLDGKRFDQLPAKEQARFNNVKPK